MKNTASRLTATGFLTTAILCGCAVVQGQTIHKRETPSVKEVQIDIIRYNSGLLKPPDPQVAKHKHHDIVVYKAEADPIYGVACFIIEKDTLRMLGWGVGARDNDLDEVYYHWTNDTTVILRFVNSTTKKQERFSITGNSKQSEIERLKDE